MLALEMVWPRLLFISDPRVIERGREANHQCGFSFQHMHTYGLAMIMGCR